MTVNNLDRYLPDILAGQTTAFAYWMAGCESAVRNSLRSFAASVDTEAVVQETFLRIWQVAPGFRPDGRPNGLLRLAFRIAKNLAISEARRLRTASAYRKTLAGGAASIAGDDGPRPPDPMLRNAIADCRERLPAKPGQALAARLHSAGRAPDSELAAHLGMSKNTFLQNFTRARKFLAQCLEEQGVDLSAEMA